MLISSRDAVALLDAVRDFLADDHPRLAYADWLDAHGRSPRAEFIRLQCELAKNRTWDGRNPRMRSLLARCRAVAHAATGDLDCQPDPSWLRGRSLTVGPHAVQATTAGGLAFTWVRGFVDVVQGYGGRLSELPPDVVGPVGRVRVVGFHPASFQTAGNVPYRPTAPHDADDVAWVWFRSTERDETAWDNDAASERTGWPAHLPRGVFEKLRGGEPAPDSVLSLAGTPHTNAARMYRTRDDATVALNAVFDRWWQDRADAFEFAAIALRFAA